MPWAFGPILTAGVALATAAVVVTNPVVVPRADVQIPVADLPVAFTGDGHRGTAVDMLDEEFIRAVGPDAAASTNPLAVLTDLVRVLVADAASLGKNAILHAFATGAKVIADPVLTSTSYPYVPVVTPDVAALPWPTQAPPTVTDAGGLGPVVAQALTAILADVADVSGARAVAAAFAAGAAVATEQLPVVGAVVQAVQQDLGQIIGDPVSVIAVMPRTREVIGDGIRTVVGYLPLIGPIALWEPSSSSGRSAPDTTPTPEASTPAEDPSQSVVEGPAADIAESAASPLTERRVRGSLERQAGAESHLDAAEPLTDTVEVEEPADLSPESGAELSPEPGAELSPESGADLPESNQRVGLRTARAAADAPAPPDSNAPGAD